jgi:hypothetical protein
LENLRWIAAAALSAYACRLAVHHTTPVDAALPLLALVVTLCAWLSYREVMVGVPLLIVAEIAIPDETMRIIAFGVIVAASSAITLASRHGLPVARGPLPGLSGLDDDASRELGTGDALRATGNGQLATSFGQRATSSDPAVPLTIAILLVLRWIPVADVRFGRELFLLACAVAIVIVLGRTPFAVAVAVATTLATPAFPLRTLALPLLVLLAAATVRLFGMPAVRLTWPSTALVAAVMLFFGWSGVVARSFPYFLTAGAPADYKRRIAEALSPGTSAMHDVPEGSRSLILSGANVARLRRGTVLGRLDPGGIALRVGDAADWGYQRRDHFYAARNPLPRDAAGKIRDYGYSAWLDGAGRVPLPPGARRIRVTADPKLPATATLQVEGFE